MTVIESLIKFVEFDALFINTNNNRIDEPAQAYKQATGMTKISRGGIFEKFSAGGGVFYRKFRILTGSRVFSLIKP